jgi:sulfite reductase (NADPH) flavoprotein alpha-component
MDEYPVGDLSKEKTVLAVSSTWGDGEPPDNAVEFWKALSAEEVAPLNDLRFAVLGLGDSNYLNFCGMGKQLDARFEALGARRLVPRSDCDTDFEDTAKAWFALVMEQLTGTGSATPAEPVIQAGTEVAYGKKRPFPAKLLENRRLNAPEADRDTRHFEISLEGSGLSYDVGDVLGVYPKNDPARVDELIEALQLEPDAAVPLPGQADETATLREALMAHYDIRTVRETTLKAWPVSVHGNQFHELIDLVHATQPTFASSKDFVSLLKKLAPRLYSISSSPLAHPGEVHLTVAKVRYYLEDRWREGVCSSFLADRVEDGGEIPVFIQAVKHFKLPQEPSRAVIMIGPGTGVAPFRAFLEERARSGASGKNWLFFGNPHQATDWFYREEFEDLFSQGVLTNLSTAWSRDQEDKIYVQDRLREQGAEVWAWMESGAHIYVCGDAKRMAKDVDTALHEIVAEHGKRDGGDYMAALKKEKRYQRDVY